MSNWFKRLFKPKMFDTQRYEIALKKGKTYDISANIIMGGVLKEVPAKMYKYKKKVVFQDRIM
jgi:hypothetical protein